MKNGIFVFSAIAVAMMAVPAAAHVGLENRQAAPGSYYKATFQISHGCNGAPTVQVRVKIPEGVISVKPQPKPGWKLSTVLAKLPQPVDAGHGKTINETVSEVSWSGGNLSNDHFDEFKIAMKLPDRPGAEIYFPVVQDCQKGVHRWIEIPEKGKPASELKEPAPKLQLTPKP